MDRRGLLKAAVASPFALSSPGTLFAAARPTLRRVRPSDPAWPTPESWELLKRRVGGNLLQPHALFAACRGAPKGPDCLEAIKYMGDPFYIGDQPAGTEVSGWLDAWSPAPSAYVVAAHSGSDVAAAVNFARENHLRLVVKGTGHSYQGTSNAADSLMIWTRAMNEITLHDNFVPRGCGPSTAPVAAVTVGGGAMGIDAYDAVTTKAGRYVQGGGCTTVGLTGLVQSGGFGSFSKQFGMACASLLQAQIVTADGVLRTVNACRDADLFWALKGGGGGAWGVVTSLTLRTHELPEFFGGADGTIKASTDDAYRRLIDKFLAFYEESLFNPHWGESVHFRPDNRLEISMVCAGLKYSEANAVWRPFFDWVAASPADYAFTDKPDVGTTLARGWWDAQARLKRGSTSMIPDKRPGAPAHHAWWSGDQAQVGAFLYAYDSLWLDGALLAPDRRARLVDALFAASRHSEVQLHINKGLAGAPDEAKRAASNTAVNPGVVDAFALAIIATGGPSQYPDLPFPPLGLANARASADGVAKAAAALRVIAPAAGSYLSESNYFNAFWREAYWGANYPRLEAVKAKYDPGGLFFVHHGVGSDQWSADGFTRLART